MNWNKSIRQMHRWVSIIFTLTVAANFIAMALGKPPSWLVYSPLPFLFLLMFSRSLHVRAAVCRQAAQRVMYRLIGANAGVLVGRVSRRRNPPFPCRGKNKMADYAFANPPL